MHRFLLVVLGLACACSAAADVAYVRNDAPDGGDGLSWATAKRNLRGGLTVARENDAITEIWVAAGTYRCNGEPFELVQGIPIYGGFTGDETDWQDRDPIANECILDGQYQCRVLRGGYGWPMGDLLLDGFLITGGRDWQGGAWENYEANPIFINCRFIGNQAHAGDGGAIYNYDGEGLFVNCDFRGNTASARGGAINWYDCKATFVNCRFRSNESGGSGGAIEVYANGGHFINCTFFGNRVGETVFPTNIVSGSAIMDYRGVCRLDNCIVWGNTGGGWIEYPFTEHAYFPPEGPPTYNWSVVAWEGFLGENNHVLHPELEDSGEATEPQVFSSAIDSGNHFYLPADIYDLDRDGDVTERISLDLSGKPRFVNATVVEDQIPADLNPPPALDRGAYEFDDDCNGNGISDILDIQAGAPDCDGDQIPDECELDWDGDGIADICAILAGDEPDCNENLALDPMDVARGTSLDRNNNGQPDECDTDCNGNRIPDEIDISSGFSANCNNNLIPDECEVPTPEEAYYGVSDGSAEVYLTDNGTQDLIWLQGFEIEAGRERIRGIDYVIGDIPSGRSCSVALWHDEDGDRDPGNATLVVSRQISVILDGNDAFDRVRLPETIEFEPGDFVFVGVIYAQLGGEGSAPLDQDGASPDAWIAYDSANAGNLSESGGLDRVAAVGYPGRWLIRMVPALSLPNDCNANLRPDNCDIANGAADSDGDGVLDACDVSDCFGDLDKNLIVDGGDLTELLSAWGSGNPRADLDRNGVVDGADLNQLLAAWGPC